MALIPYFYMWMNPSPNDKNIKRLAGRLARFHYYHYYFTFSNIHYFISTLVLLTLSSELIRKLLPFVKCLECPVSEHLSSINKSLKLISSLASSLCSIISLLISNPGILVSALLTFWSGKSRGYVLRIVGSVAESWASVR